ncbi:MAG: hypothetical protein HYZ71_06895 [Deltaproteobacteria bacterium]|nr:hypothetical protein [Deltaproteobacteria bacterium]
MILTVPFFEFFVLRFWLHSILNVRIGFPFLTDYDYVCPSLLAFLILMLRLQQEEPVSLQIRKTTAAIHLLLVATFVTLSLNFSWLKASHLLWLWWGAAATTLVSGLFVLVKASYFFGKKNRYRVLAALPIAGSKLIARQLFAFLWVPAMHLTGLLVYGGLRPFFSDLSHTVHLTNRQEEYVHISNSAYTLAIGVGCSGLEGVGFVGAALLFTIMLDPKRLRPIFWINCLLTGLIAFYLLNVLRLGLVFSIATVFLHLFGHDIGVASALTLVHDSMGWLLHAAGFLVLYKWIYSERPSFSLRIPAWSRAGVAILILSTTTLFAAIEPPSYKPIDPWSIPPLDPNEAAVPPPPNLASDPSEYDFEPTLTLTPTCDDDALADTTCQAGAATWRYVSSSTMNLYLENTCGTQCTCGNVPATGGVCYGCGYQSQWKTTKCYSNTGCTIACTPAPQFLEGWSGVGWIASALFPVWYHSRRRRRCPPP